MGPSLSVKTQKLLTLIWIQIATQGFEPERSDILLLLLSPYSIFPELIFFYSQQKTYGLKGSKTQDAKDGLPLRTEQS